MALTFDVVQHDASTLSLNLNVSGIELRGKLRARDLRLKQNAEGGQVSGAEISVEGFEIRSGGFQAQTNSFSGKGVTIAWGDAGLRIVADALSGPALSLEFSTGRLQLGSWSLEGLSFQGGQVEVLRGALSDAKLDLHLEQPEGEPVPDESDEVHPADQAPPPRRTKIFDWHLLDALQGEFNVDLEVDLTVPVIGRRRTTHRFRVPIDAGAIDYRELEKDLSTLENSILDFAVRSDGTLVLERGIPILPTRGWGKPILTWQLEPEDLALAKENRIRLAVIPHFAVAGSEATEAEATAGEATEGEATESERKEEGSSRLALRSLVLSKMETRLSLGASVKPLEAAIRFLTVEQFSLLGQVQFHPGQRQEPGHLGGEVREVESTLVDLPLAAHALSIARLHVGSVADLQGDFLGPRPSSLDCALRDVSFEELRWSPAVD